MQTWRSFRIENVSESKDSKNHGKNAGTKQPGKVFCMILVLTKGIQAGFLNIGKCLWDIVSPIERLGSCNRVTCKENKPKL